MSDFPDKLDIRDTGLHDESAGRRIYTTAGMGYERQEYIREDLCTRQQPTKEQVIDAARSVSSDGGLFRKTPGRVRREIIEALDKLYGESNAEG